MAAADWLLAGTRLAAKARELREGRTVLELPGIAVPTSLAPTSNQEWRKTWIYMEIWTLSFQWSEHHPHVKRYEAIDIICGLEDEW